MGKAYLDNQFSLKADVSQLTGLVSSDYSELKCTNSVGSATYYYKKTDVDNMLLAYSTGSYGGCNLANKVSTTGDASISGGLDVGQDQAQTSIKTYVNHVGKTGYVEMEARWANQGYIHFETNQTDGLLLFAVKDSLGDGVYMYIGDDIVYIYEDTTIGGNLNVGSTGNNSIKIHGIGATTSYAEFKVSNGQNCVWDFQNPGNSNVWSIIKVRC